MRTKQFKVEGSKLHDADNVYTWCRSGNSDFSCNANAADGSAFTDFLRSLNSGGCFAGTCDWRLPTRDELQTILADPFTGTFSACTTPSCIDPIFGPTQTGPCGYWSATASAFRPSFAWLVRFSDGLVYNYGFPLDSGCVRAVRGGL